MNRKGFSLLLATGLALFLLPTLFSMFRQAELVHAATFTVDTVNDEADGSCVDDCSLRDAITVALAGDTIFIPPGTYALSDALGQLNVGKTLIFSGTGSTAAEVIIEAGANARLFSVSSGTATFFKMTLQNGAPASGNGGAINATAAANIVLQDMVITNSQTVASGGGIALANGSLTLSNSQIVSNTAVTNGGGIYSNNGPIAMTNSQIMTNTASGSGGGIFLNLPGAVFTMNSGQINGNAANLTTGFPGGGIHAAQGNVIMHSGEIRGNVAYRGGGILIAGGVNGATFTMNAGQIVDNEANYGGGIYVRDPGAAATINDGQISQNRSIDPDSFGGGGAYIFRGIVTLNGGEFSYNSAVNDGGGLEIGDPDGRFTQTGGAIHNNSAGNMGGGLYNAEGVLTITDGTLHTNQATNGGGGLYTGPSSINTVTNSAILTNTAVSPASGGGLVNHGSLTLTNVTLSGNSANSGAGLLNTGTAVLANVTLSQNSATATGGGLQNSGGSLTVGNSIIYGNSAAAGADCSGTITSAGNNFSGCGFSSSGDSSSDPQLLPLALYNGSTLNYALANSSPAVDGGSNTTCPATDQRGNLRPIDGNGDNLATCDSGAYELGLAFFVNDITLAEGDAGSSQMHFTVTRSFMTDTTYTVDYATVAGTAVANADFTAVPTTTLTFLPATMTQTVSIDILGDTLDEADEQFTVRLGNQSPAVQIGDFSGLGTILDDDAPPSVSLNDLVFNEADGGSITAVFTATLSAPSGKTITVDYATQDGTAVANADYTSASGTFTFNPGDTETSIAVTIANDALDEFDEQFTLELSNPSNVSLGDGTGQATITDDDNAPTVSIDSINIPEGNSGTTPANFVVSLSAPSGKTITVDYQTSANSATANTDYISTSGTLTITAGLTSETITVTVNGDTVDELNETFNITLSNATNATVASDTAVGTITDDDPLPTATISNASLTEGDSGTAVATFTVTLSAASEKIITIAYSSANGSALAGADFTAVAGTLTFNPGDPLSQTISVIINGDEDLEPDEQFYINLTGSSNVTLGNSQATGTILNDDGSFIYLPMVVKP